MSAVPLWQEGLNCFTELDRLIAQKIEAERSPIHVFFIGPRLASAIRETVSLMVYRDILRGTPGNFDFADRRIVALRNGWIIIEVPDGAEID
jgi:hypothetical protein